jgi:hypothetical protein
MSSVLQIVDPANTASVLYDCNDPTGAANPGGAVSMYGLGGEFTLAKPAMHVGEWESDLVPGGSTLYARDGLATCMWRQRLKATTLDNLTTAVGELARLLRLGGVLKWIPDGSALTKYVDFEPSERPGLFDGREGDLYHALRLFETPRGILIALRCQPSLRSDILDPTVNLLTNPSLLLDGGTGRPGGWAWDSETGLSAFSIDSTEDAAKWTAATTATRSLRQIVTPAAVGETWSGSFSAWASDNVTARMRVVLEFLDAANAVLATTTGTLVLLSVTEKRITVTSSAAPASTAKIRVSLQQANAAATSVNMWARYAQAEKAASVSLYRVGLQQMSNDPTTIGGLAAPFTVQGDYPAPIILRAKAFGASDKVAAFILAARTNNGIPGGRRLTDYLNTRKVFQCESGTLTGDTTSVVDGAQTVAQTAYTTNPTIMAKRIRVALTTFLDCMRGEFDIWVRIKATAAAKHTLQLRWAPSAADPVSFSGPEVVHDTTGFSAFTYIIKRLGRITIPEDPAVTLAGLTLELWSRRDTGTGSLNWDFIFPLPADVPLPNVSGPTQATIKIPGQSEETFPASINGVLAFIGGASFTNPAGKLNGTLRTDGRYDLNANTEAGGTAPAAGFAWPVGHHRLTFHTRVRDDGTVNITYACRIRNITDNNDAKTQPFTRGASHPNAPQDYEDTIEFDSVAGKSYEPQVEYTSATTRSLGITDIVHEFVPYLAQNEQLRTDAERLAVEKVDTNGALVTYVDGVEGGVPFRLPPGLWILQAIPLDIPTDLYSDYEHVLARTATIAISHAPRWQT